MLTVLCVEKGRQHSDNQVYLELREKVTSFHIHQTTHLSTHSRCVAHVQIPPSGAYNNPAALKSKLRIISRTVRIIKCWCLVFRCYIQKAPSIAEAYHPHVQMFWEVFKGLWALERGNSAAFDLCCCLWWRCTGPGPAMAQQHSTNNRSSRPPPTFVPTSPPALSRHNGNKGLRVL